MARAKQTGRAEARRRYRQTTTDTPVDDGQELDFGERKPDQPASRTGRGADPRAGSQYASGRLGFGAALRGAYHPANVREDLRTLPSTLRSRAFLIAVAMVVAGAAAVYAFPMYTGSQFAWELLVVPGAALAPQLVAGFFAPRASYMLGFFVALIQGAAYVLVVTSERVRAAIEAIQPGALPNLEASAIATALISAVLMSTLFAAAAAWYRRFLALSSPRRPPAGRAGSRNQGGGRPAARPSSAKRGATR